jgi:hypothetical protein
LGNGAWEVKLGKWNLRFLLLQQNLSDAEAGCSCCCYKCSLLGRAIPESTKKKEQTSAVLGTLSQNISSLMSPRSVCSYSIRRGAWLAKRSAVAGGGDVDLSAAPRAYGTTPFWGPVVVAVAVAVDRGGSR